MAAGVSGSFTIKGSKAGITCRVNYSETYDVASNTSSVTVSIQFKAGTGGYYGYTYYLDGNAKIDGATVMSCSSSAGNATVSWGALESYAYMKAGSATSWTRSGIVHNPDGSRSVAISVSLAGYTGSGSGGSGWTVNGSQTIRLTTIPRASDIGATDANVGAVSLVVVTRKSTAYSHSVAYAFGELSGYLTADGGVSETEVKFTEASVAFAVPQSFYSQIPDARSGVCTLTCRTWSGAVQIGAATACTFTVTAAESECAPDVTGTVTDANPVTLALTGDGDRLVRFFSTARCTIAAQAKNAASILRQTIAGVQVDGDSRDIGDVETDTFLFSATDSRGYTASAAVTRPMVDYVRLTCNGAASRPSPIGSTAVLALAGNFFDASFGAVDNELTVSYRIDGGRETAVETVREGGRWSAAVTLSDVAYTESYTITVTAADKLMTVTQTVILNRGVPAFDWGKNDFRVNVPLGLPGGLALSARDVLRDLVYPVGSYFWSSEETDPADLLGGTWERIEDVFLLAAGGAFQPGDTGGEAEHVLTVEEMPAHKHSHMVTIDMTTHAAMNRSVVVGGGAIWTTGDLAQINNAGGDMPHNNMPPYIAAYCWHRTA